MAVSKHNGLPQENLPPTPQICPNDQGRILTLPTCQWLQKRRN